jgi:cytochrome P450
MARLHAETDAVLADADSPPEADQFARLSYLDLVFKEALRMYPPIHVGNRRAFEDLTIAGYARLAGTGDVPIYLASGQRLLAGSRAFQPGAVRAGQDENGRRSHVPSGVDRNCIGASFAQVEAKVVLPGSCRSSTCSF